jgi:hypothetical protein
VWVGRRVEWGCGRPTKKTPQLAASQAPGLGAPHCPSTGSACVSTAPLCMLGTNLSTADGLPNRLNFTACVATDMKRRPTVEGCMAGWGRVVAG